jgi:hypothetical protein
MSYAPELHLEDPVWTYFLFKILPTASQNSAQGYSNKNPQNRTSQLTSLPIRSLPFKFHTRMNGPGATKIVQYTSVAAARSRALSLWMDCLRSIRKLAPAPRQYYLDFAKSVRKHEFQLGRRGAFLEPAPCVSCATVTDISCRILNNTWRKLIWNEYL